MLTLGDLANQLELQLQGDEKHPLHRVSTLESATVDSISFLANPSYRKYLENSQAGAVILSPEDAQTFSGNALIANNPYVTFARVAQLFAKPRPVASGIAASAHISQSAQLGDGVAVGHGAVIGAGCVIGEGSQIGPNVVLAEDVRIGESCEIKARVVIEAGCRLGDRVVIHPGAVIGADGFGLARGQEGWVKIPQTGVVIIGDDSEVGANTTIDRGAIEDTVLGRDVRLDNQVQIGHNVRIGDHTVVAGCGAIAGSAKVGKNCMIGGGAGVVGHIEICDQVVVQAMALVTHSIKKPGSYSAVSPLQPTTQWRKNAVRARQLDSMARQIKALEKKIDE